MTEYCNNENLYNIKIDEKNIDNLASKYKLYCKRSYLSPFLNSAFFLVH